MFITIIDILGVYLSLYALRCQLDIDEQETIAAFMTSFLRIMEKQSVADIKVLSWDAISKKCWLATRAE